MISPIHSKQLDIAYFHHKLRRHDATLDICTRILTTEPDHVEALYLSALSRIGLGDEKGGGTELLKVMDLCPSRKLYDSYYENLKRAELLPEGLKRFETWVERNPEDFLAQYYLGLISLDLYDRTNAASAFHKAMELNPSHAPTLAGLARLRNEEQRYDEVERLLKKAADLSPATSYYLNNLAGVLKTQGRGDEAEEYYARAVAIDPHNSKTHSNRLMNLLCSLKSSPEQIFAAHREWEKQCARSLSEAIAPHPNDPDHHRPLRIGYVSSDFRRHPVAFFVLPILLAHDRRNFDIHIYSNIDHPDFITDQFKELGYEWTDISKKSDDEAADTIRRDGIDILVDLNGHTNNNRLLLFALKPAPVQVTWLGYANTTGLATIDYRITDAIADPPGVTDRFHSEKLFRMPDSFICYCAPQNPPPVGPLPAEQSGIVTFGVFNNFAKTNEKIFFLWSEILKKTPGSRLMMKISGSRHEEFRNRIFEKFESFGIPRERIITREWEGHILQHLNLFNEMDIALDTFPYNGTTTTCEALFMGVPVISLAGATHVSRVGASLLGHVGVPELAAGNEEEYVRKAAELAADIPRMAGYRSRLRERMRISSVMDSEGFTRKLETGYRRMWREWVGSSAAGKNP